MSEKIKTDTNGICHGLLSPNHVNSRSLRPPNDPNSNHHLSLSEHSIVNHNWNCPSLPKQSWLANPLQICDFNFILENRENVQEIDLSFLSPFFSILS